MCTDVGVLMRHSCRPEKCCFYLVLDHGLCKWVFGSLRLELLSLGLHNLCMWHWLVRFVRAFFACAFHLSSKRTSFGTLLLQSRMKQPPCHLPPFCSAQLIFIINLKEIKGPAFFCGMMESKAAEVIIVHESYIHTKFLASCGHVSAIRQEL